MRRAEIFSDLCGLHIGEIGACGWQGDAGAETIRYWSDKLKVSERQLLDDVALDVADEFLAGNVGWEFGDWVANKVLFSGITDFGLGGGPMETPDPWWGVYLAFDDSETVKAHTEVRARENIEDFLAELANRT